jgi:hypothetical protein
VPRAKSCATACTAPRSPDGDDAGFIAACSRIASDGTLRRAMGTAARSAVSGLRPEQVAADFDRILQSLANREMRHGIAGIA